MFGTPSLSKEKELVWAQFAVFPSDKALFLRPMLKRPLQADHQRQVKTVSPGIAYVWDTLKGGIEN